MVGCFVYTENVLVQFHYYLFGKVEKKFIIYIYIYINWVVLW